jgi:hypothetical protein
MQKIFTTVFMAAMLLVAHAEVTLNISRWDDNEGLVTTRITKDTTIVVSEYGTDYISNKEVMEIMGDVSTQGNYMNIDIQRSTTGVEDQFCMGACYEGNGETFETHNVAFEPKSTQDWSAHFFPKEPGVTTISYAFDDGCNCLGGRITLTVKYCYLTSAVESVVAPTTNGKIYNLLGQEMPTAELNELPAGIYVINGKKYIKQ